MRQQLTGTTTKTEPVSGYEPTLVDTQRQQDLAQMFEAHKLTAAVQAVRKARHNCCHHWLIEVAVDPFSKGVCKLCGEERLFRNKLRWSEIAPARALNGWRQVTDSVSRGETLFGWPPKGKPEGIERVILVSGRH